MVVEVVEQVKVIKRSHLLVTTAPCLKDFNIRTQLV